MMFPITNSLSIYQGIVNEGSVMVRIFTEEEKRIFRGFMAKYSILHPFLRELRNPELSNQYVLRFKGKNFAVYSINGEIRIRGGQSEDNGILTFWNYLVGEYWYPELIQYFKNNQ